MNKLLEVYYNYKKQIIISAIIMVAIILIVAYLSLNRIKANTKDEVENSNVEVINNSESSDETQENIIKINVKGAVNSPGVYELNLSSRVIDAIEKSGGLSKNADTSILNLSKKLSDEDVIIVYTKDEVKKIKEGNMAIEYIEKECNCPYIQNSACIESGKVLGNDISTNSNKDIKISINTATLEELQTLTGIGQSKAEDIIEYRNKNGQFKVIEDILNVKGIGDALFEKIKNNITV